MAILNKLISAAVMTIVLTGCYSDFEPDIDLSLIHISEPTRPY